MSNFYVIVCTRIMVEIMSYIPACVNCISHWRMRRGGGGGAGGTVPMYLIRAKFGRYSGKILAICYVIINCGHM